MAPLVEHESAVAEAGPVSDFHCRERTGVGVVKLAEGLHGIKCAGVVGSLDIYIVGSDG